MTRFADNALLNDAARRACRYLEDLGQRPVAPAAAALAGLEKLGGALPDEGMAPASPFRCARSQEVSAWKGFSPCILP